MVAARRSHGDDGAVCRWADECVCVNDRLIHAQFLLVTSYWSVSVGGGSRVKGQRVLSRVDGCGCDVGPYK